jgi:hypothetical protein
MDVLSAPRRVSAIGRPIWQIGLAVWFVGQLLMVVSSALPMAPGAVMAISLFGFALWVGGLGICVWRLLVKRQVWSMLLALGLGLVLLAGMVQAVRTLMMGPG